MPQESKSKWVEEIEFDFRYCNQLFGRLRRGPPGHWAAIFSERGPVSSGVNDWGKKVSPPLPLGVLGLLEPVFNQQSHFQSYKTVAKPRRPRLAFRLDSIWPLYLQMKSPKTKKQQTFIQQFGVKKLPSELPKSGSIFSDSVGKWLTLYPTHVGSRRE